MSECLELLQTEGSVFEESEHDESDELWGEEGSMSEGSESEHKSEVGVPTPITHDSPTDQPSQTAADQDLSRDAFLQFFLQEWHEYFSFFPAVPPFTGTSGLHLSKECHAPLDFFEEIFDEELLGLIVDETNRYAQVNLAAWGDLRVTVGIWASHPYLGMLPFNYIDSLTFV